VLREFTFYLTERRKSVPCLTFATVRDVERARELAAKMLAEDPNHVRLEAWEGEHYRFALYGDPPSEPTESPSLS
jgi:hypothetical protein